MTDSETTACETCRELADEEERAERTGDHSRAADYRVLRRRHEEFGHRPEPQPSP
ncbi:hypothetical protein ACFYXL_30355 [Streptomyces tsukubensis]|uniref:hypothetical protein n=1 Tax=Streptomyces tsukubensis TaxID=83656 RepID=UPI0036AA8F8B